MAFNSPTNWDLRTTGSDSNGGGFDPVSGSPGTNFAQQDSPQAAYTDIVIDAVTNTKITSVARAFSSVDVGNIINMTAGTGFTVQRIQILSVAAGVATCDKAVGTTSSTGGTGNFGGGLLTAATVNGLVVAGNTVNVKSGTYTLTVTVTLTASGSASAGPIMWRGYGTNWGDAGTPPVFTSATNSVALFTYTGANFIRFQNIKLTHTATTRGSAFVGVTTAGTNWAIEDCIIDGALSGIDQSSRILSPLKMHNCLIQNTTSHGINGLGSFTEIDSCIFNNAGNGAGTFHGILSATNTISDLAIRNSIVAKSSGKGIYDNGTTRVNTISVVNCTIVDNASDGFRADATPGSAGALVLVFKNNTIWGNGGVGASVPNASAAHLLAEVLIDRNNFYGSNTGGDRSVLPVGVGDVTGISDPFVSRAGQNWGLNNTAGAGALIRAAAFPGVLLGTSTTGFLDGGAVQHADPASGTIFVESHCPVIVNGYGVVGY